MTMIIKKNGEDRTKSTTKRIHRFHWSAFSFFVVIITSSSLKTGIAEKCICQFKNLEIIQKITGNPHMYRLIGKTKNDIVNKTIIKQRVPKYK
jgi:hypothetical protein